MKIMQKLCYLFVLLLVTNVSVWAQKSPAENADKAFNTFQYATAADLYKKAYKKVPKNPVERRRIMFRIAECYSMMGDLKRAEQQYRRLLKINYQKDNPLILLRLGEICRIKKDYPEALKFYEMYQQARPKDPRSADKIESCKVAPLWINNPTRHEVENMKKFNSVKSDWSPMWGNSKETEIVFTSSREGSTGKHEDAWTGQFFSDLYVSTKPKSKTVEFPGEWTLPVLYDETKVINTEANEGEASFNDKGTTIYFTRCPKENKAVVYCKIYQATRKGKGWGDTVEIKLGSDSFDYVHPSISSDELTLYFVSDMPGTMGGYDIWQATRSKKGKPFDAPVNLGPNVNSHEHDMYPSLENDSTLYFASKGHVGLGGFDIFKSKLVNGKWTPAENLKYPINSEANDYGIIFDHSDAIDLASGFPYIEKGYFTSDRAGGKGHEDIWWFKLRPIVFTLAGFIRDSLTMQPIDGATVTISGSNGMSYKTTTDVKGYYYYDKTQILGESTYEITVKKEGYYDNENTKGKETTVGLTENKDLRHDFKINPLPKAPIPMPDILYKLADWELLPASKDSLRSLLKTMQKYPTLVIELRSHTDNRPFPQLTNDTLSQRRAQSCVNFLIEEGIDPERLVARGYAERIPRTLERDIVSRGVLFKKGTVLTPEYINALKTSNEKEGAHDLNRRTEFMILRDDYVPKDVVPTFNPSEYKIDIIKKRFINVTADDKLVSGTCYVNSKTLEFKIEPNVEQMTISYDQAMRFLREAIITVGDFEEGAKAIVETDGTIIDKSIVYLNTMQIGEQVLENVKMIVVKGQKEPIIIGSKTFEEEFGTYTIDKGEQRLYFDK